MNRRKTGFTLIELLIVVSIIAIFSAVIIIIFQSVRAKTRDAARKNDLREIQNAMVIYQDNNNGDYPSSLSQLVPDYLPKLPKDPKTNDDYSYVASQNLGLYELNAVLESGVDNSANIDGGNEAFPIYEVGSDLTLLP